MAWLIVDKLPTVESLNISLYDPEIGDLLVAKGEALTTEIIGDLRACGYDKLFASNDPAAVNELRRNNNFAAMPLLEIKPDTVMASDIFDASGTLLVSKGMRISANMLGTLARRKVQTVMLRKEISPAFQERLQRAREAIYKRQKVAAMGLAEFAPAEVIADPAAVNPRAIEKLAQQMEAKGDLNVDFDPAESLKNLMSTPDPMRPRAEKQKAKFVDIYRGMLTRTETLFKHLKRSEKVESKTILQMCDDLIKALVADRELLLCSMFLPHVSADYLAQHSLNVAILAVNIATAHGYSPKMVVEVGYGALLMDVGMLDVPDAIRFKKGELTLVEINELRRHTIYGMDRLQCIQDLPKTTAMVAYQSHERLDGSGYPHGKGAHAIHDYSKLVAVADVYHAMIDNRPFRDGALLPYKAMEELLRMGARNKIDRRFIRSLLAAVSLFPVASWVRLNTGETARVLQASDQQFTKPVVIILYDANGAPYPEPKRVDLKETADVEVVAAVKAAAQPDGDGLMAGF